MAITKVTNKFEICYNTWVWSITSKDSYENDDTGNGKDKFYGTNPTANHDVTPI